MKKKKTSRTEPFATLECPVCGRVFLKPVQVVYKVPVGGGHTRPVCSYTCMRKVEKEQEARTR